MITQEEWMDLLSCRSLAASGATWAEIARLAGYKNDLAKNEVGGSNVDTMVPPEGFEPSTSRSGGARSNPLSYEGT